MGKEAENIPDVDLKLLSNRIKDLRKQTGFSAEQFAYEHKIARSQYSRYEAGKDIRYSTLIKIIRAFNLTPSEFFEGIE